MIADICEILKRVLFSNQIPLTANCKLNKYFYKTYYTHRIRVEKFDRDLVASVLYECSEKVIVSFVNLESNNSMTYDRIGVVDFVTTFP